MGNRATNGRSDRKPLKLIIACVVVLFIVMVVFSGSGPKDNGYPEKSQNTIKKIPDFSGELPNIIIINADDLGYGDLGCYDGRAIKTPNIDTLAKEGTRFTDFNACDSVCSPSRAGLLTGRYPKRMKLDVPLHPGGQSLKKKILVNIGYLAGKLGLLDLATENGADGLNKNEITIAEALKLRDYKTGMVGKWHLGDYSGNSEFNPVNHGFDFYFGVPHSNDMHPFPLYRNEEELEAHVTEQGKLTGMYTEEAIQFIKSSKDNPFFLYFAHTFPHRPLYASKEFQNRSEGGFFGDTVEEIDWSVGRILQVLKENNLDEKTVVMFTSDNGPWYQGSPGAFRGRKGQSFEGGHRIPFIVRHPGQIPPGGECREPAMNIDLLPTCLSLAGLTLPADRKIDGRNIQELMIEPDRKSPHENFYFYHHGELEGIRSGNWKYLRSMNHYVWPMPVNKKMGRLSNHTTGPAPLLFNLEKDPGEAYNLMTRYPDIGEKLEKRMARWEKEMEENEVGWIK